MAADVQELIANLKDEDHVIRREAATALAKISGDPSLNALIGALRDKNFYVRLAAVKGLGVTGNSKALPALQDLLNDPAFIVRQAAMWTLGELGDPAAIPALQNLVGDTTRFPEGELNIGQVAQVVIKRIELAVAAKNQPAPTAGSDAAPATSAEPGTLTPEERKARREAALARKAAGGGDAPAPAATAPVVSADPGTLTPEERKARREAALARKAAAKTVDENKP